jgi:hypothetical protein
MPPQQRRAHRLGMRARPRHRRPRRWIQAPIGVAAGVVAFSLAAAGCGGQQGAPPAQSHRAAASPSQPAPASPTVVPSPTPAPSRTSPPQAPGFSASTSVLTAAMRARMTGVSWHRGCPVSLDSLRLLRLSYWGPDRGVHRGELVVNESAAASLTHAFRLLFYARFPITRMQVVDDFGGDDERSMLADNTSAFNCRIVPGTNTWSQHAYGLAVDVNPFENPEVSDGNVDPPAAAAWADRSRPSPAAITGSGAAWRAFDAIGWTWGGDWQSPKDYMHFSANGL